jgi:hypothetical protein
MHISEQAVELKLTGRSGELLFKDNLRTATAYIEISGISEYEFLVSMDA